MADWPQRARTKILADFNLADGRVLSSHAPNLPHTHARLRSLKGVACLISPVRDCPVRSRKLYGALRTEASIIVFGLQPLVRDYSALKENLKTSLEGSVNGGNDSSE